MHDHDWRQVPMRDGCIWNAFADALCDACRLTCLALQAGFEVCRNHGTSSDICRAMSSVMEGPPAPPPSMEGIERKPSALKRRVAPNAGLVVSAEAHSHWVDAYQKNAGNNCLGIKSRCLRMRTQTTQL